MHKNPASAVLLNYFLFLPHYPQVVRRALAAGKHVMQEKPVADSLENALHALQHYRQLRSVKPVWMIAENYRYVPQQNNYKPRPQST
jgi:predicted dehydrogenase